MDKDTDRPERFSYWCESLHQSTRRWQLSDMPTLKAHSFSATAEKTTKHALNVATSCLQAQQACYNLPNCNANVLYHTLEHAATVNCRLFRKVCLLYILPGIVSDNCPCPTIASERRVYLDQQIFAVTEATANLCVLLKDCGVTEASFMIEKNDRVASVSDNPPPLYVCLLALDVISFVLARPKLILSTSKWHPETYPPNHSLCCIVKITSRHHDADQASLDCLGWQLQVPRPHVRVYVVHSQQSTNQFEQRFSVSLTTISLCVFWVKIGQGLRGT